MTRKDLIDLTTQHGRADPRACCVPPDIWLTQQADAVAAPLLRFRFAVSAALVSAQAAAERVRSPRCARGTTKRIPERSSSIEQVLLSISP